MYFLKRLAKAIKKRILITFDLSDWNKYKKSIYKWEKSTNKESCIIICNGPSLKKIEMNLLKDFDCFGMNRAYLAFEDWGFIPKYFVCINELVLEQFHEDIDKIDTNKFLNHSKRKLFSSKNSNFLMLAFKDRVVNNLSYRLSTSATVTFVSIQLAIIMGYRRIGIVGLDHSFSGPGSPHETLNAETKDENHFLPNYFSGGIKWEYPDLVRNEKGYELLRKYAESKDIEIFDCTNKGKSNAFNKINLNEFIFKT